jgi:hypothetical protein
MRPKRHHYVPRFYLAGFTQERAKDGRLHVFDLREGKQRTGTPNGEGRETDLYTIDHAQPHSVEGMFAKIEGLFVTILRQIEDSRSLPADDKQLSELLTFVALQSARVPKLRRMREQYYDATARVILDTVAQSDETFDAAMRQMAASGVPVANTSRGKLLAALPNLRFQINPSTLIRDMLWASEAVNDLLCMRKWALLVAEPGVPDFVTSDNPVSLVPTRRTTPHALGFAMPHTAVFYPLTPRLALHGTFEGRQRRVVSLRSEQVAAVNLATILAAQRFVWSRRKRIYFRWGADLRRDLSSIRMPPVE